MKKYRAATNYACDLVEPFIDESGKLKFAKTNFATSVFLFSEHIELRQKKTLDLLHPDYENSDQVYYDLVGPAIGAILVSLAKADGEFFDYCAHVCGVNILAGIPLPQLLKKFASDVLKGNASRPKKKRSRPRKKVWLEKEYLWRLTHKLVQDYDLLLTRNDDGSNRTSACDAVAEALTVCGRKTSFTEIKNLMVHPDNQRFREEFEATRKIVSRLGKAATPKNALAPGYGEFWIDASRKDVLDILDTFPPKRK
jgi:hypothetical protein